MVLVFVASGAILPTSLRPAPAACLALLPVSAATTVSLEGCCLRANYDVFLMLGDRLLEPLLCCPPSFLRPCPSA